MHYGGSDTTYNLQCIKEDIVNSKMTTAKRCLKYHTFIIKPNPTDFSGGGGK